jgi:hypothetical protein
MRTSAARLLLFPPLFFRRRRFVVLRRFFSFVGFFDRLRNFITLAPLGSDTRRSPSPGPLEATFHLHDEARLLALILLFPALEGPADVLVGVELGSNQGFRLCPLILPGILIVGIHDRTPDLRALLNSQTSTFRKAGVKIVVLVR